MKYHICCSCCGRELVRSESCAKSDMLCPKCGAEIEYEVKETTAIIRVLKPSPKKPRV